MIKRITTYICLVVWVYGVTFGLFLTEHIKLPLTILAGIPLLLTAEKRDLSFNYWRENLFFLLAVFFYFYVGQDDYKALATVMVNVIMCSLVFSVYIAANRARLYRTVGIFIALLLLSGAIMLLNHSFPEIDRLRSLLLDEQVKQSPAGIATTQFNFGYQLAALTSFLFTWVFCSRKALWLKTLVAGLCCCLIFWGMNRSVLVCFVASSVLFLIVYYRFKAVIIISFFTLIVFFTYTLLLNGSVGSKNNILEKNQAPGANDFNRIAMSVENMGVFAEYPLGLIFYGKDWKEVTYRNPMFPEGLSSHNAYLMFFTYLGPLLGLLILTGIYAGIFRATLKVGQRGVTDPDNALSMSLLFGFFAVSLNALSHTGWLINADGPTCMLFFSILQREVQYRSLPANNMLADTVSRHADIRYNPVSV